MAEVGIKITAQNDTASAFNSAQRSLSGLKAEAEGLQSSIANAIGKFGSIALVIGAAFETASLKSIIDLGDRIDDLAEKTGVSAKELSQWRYASEVAGTSLEGLTTGITKLTKNMASAAGGSKDQIAAFESIGVSVKTASGALRSTDEVLADVANKFASYADGPEKAALAMELFGKSGQDMIPILNKGSQGIAQLRGEAVALGAVFGDDLAKQSGEFNDNLKRIAISGEALKIKLAGQLLPTLNSLAEAFVDSRKGGSGFADMLGGGLKTVLQTVTVLGAEVAFVFKGLGTEIGGIAAQAAALGRLDFKGFSSIGAAMRADAAAARADQDALTRRLSGVKDSTRGAGFADPRSLGDVEGIEAQTRAWLKAAPIVKKAAEAAKEAASAYDSLNLSMQQRLSVLQAELSGGRKLTEGEKFDADMRTKLADATTKLTADERLRLAATLDIVTAKSKLVEVQQRELKAAQDAFAISTAAQDETLKALRDEQDLRNKIRLTVMASTQSTQEAVDLAEVEATSIFNTAEDRKRILDYYRIELDLRNKIKAINANGGLDQAGRDELIAIESTNAARLKGVADLAAGTARTSAMLDSIDQTAHTVFTNVLTDGVNAFTRIGQTIKAAVLDLLYQITIKKWILSIGATVTGTGAMAQSAAGSVGGAGSLGSIASSAANYFGPQTMSSLSAAAGAAGFVYAASAAASGKWGDAIGTAIGTTIGGPVGAVIGHVLGSSLDKLTGNTGTKPSIEGGYASTGTIGAANGRTYTNGVYGGAIDDSAKAIVTDLTSTYSGLVKSIGGKLGNLTAQAFIGLDGNGGSKGSQNALSLDAQLNGQWLFNRFTQQGGNINAGTTTQDMQDAVNLSSKQILIKALQSTDLGGALNSYLSTVTTAGKTIAELDATLADLTGFVSFRDAVRSLPFDYLTTASVEAQKALTAAAGGLDNFKASLGNYIDLFYSDAEKTSIKTSTLAAAFRDIGITLPAIGDGTRTWYRSLVDSLGAQDLSIESNAKAYAAALGLAGAVNELAPALQATTTAATDTAAALEKAAQAQAEARTKAITDGKALFDRAMAAERTRAQALVDVSSQAYSAAAGLFDLLKSSVADLYATVSSTAAASATGAQAFIAQALSAYQTSGYLPEQADLQTAIGSARAGLDATVYASKFEADRARLVLAGQLGQLKDAAGVQLTTAEQALSIAKDQLTSLDATAKHMQDLVDAANGIDTRIVSVSDAIAALTAVLTPQASAAIITQAATPSGGAVFGGTPTAASDGSSYIYNAADFGGLSPADYQRSVSGILATLGNGTTAEIVKLREQVDRLIDTSATTANVLSGQQPMPLMVSIET